MINHTSTVRALKEPLVLILLAWLLMTGCTGVHALNPDTTESFHTGINSATQNRLARIRLENNDEFIGTHLQVTPDSLYWMTRDRLTGQLTRSRSVAASRILDISVLNRRKSGLFGTGVGLVTGFLFGAVPALNKASTAKNSLRQRVLLFGGIFGASGALVGGVAGLKKPYRDVFVFSESMEGSQTGMLARQLKQAHSGVEDVVARLRKDIRGLDASRIKEEITPTNIVFRTRDVPFCILTVDGARVNIYLGAKQTEISDPMGLLRRWSSKESWVSISPGGDFEYTMLLIRQVFQRVQ